MGDMVGRKWGIVVSCMVFSLGIGLQLDTQWSAFIVGRFIAGVGVVCRTVCCTLCNSHLFLGARFMFSPHVSIRGIKINDITFYVYLTFDCQNLIVRPQKFTWSHCRTLPVCESVEGVILLPHHFVDVFFCLFILKNSFCWSFVISYRVEFYPKSSQSFGMESMLFSVSCHMQKDITPGLVISVASIMLIDHYQLKH